MGANDGEMLAELVTIARAEKTCRDSPAWTVTDHKNGRRIALSCPLWIDAAVVSGLRLEIRGPQAIPQNRPFLGLVAMLFVTTAGRNWHIGRIEFDPEDPLKPHRNPPNFRNLPPLVRGPQVHSFELNHSAGLVRFRSPRTFPLPCRSIGIWSLSMIYWKSCGRHSLFPEDRKSVV